VVLFFFYFVIVARDFLKNVRNDTTKRFSVGNTKVDSLTAASKSKIRLTSHNFLKLRIRS